MDFDLCLSGSLMFDRQGNHIPESDEIEDSKEIPQIKEYDGPMSQDGIDGLKTEENGDLDLPDYDLDALDNFDGLTEDPDPETGLKENDALIEDTDLIIDELAIDELVDDDITDILKESRDFWEKKKDS